MDRNLSQRDVKRAILSARQTHLSDGWPIILEAVLAGVFVSGLCDNAFVGLIAFIVALALLLHKFIGNIIAVVLAGYSCLYVCDAINKRVQRFDLAIVIGLVVGFLVYGIHVFHAQAARDFLEPEEDGEEEQ